MESATIEKLNALNREFYEAHAEAFADSRPRLAPGVKRILADIPSGARVLEVGCGDGKVGRWLARNGIGYYLGLDASAGMIARAKRFSGQWLALGTPGPWAGQGMEGGQRLPPATDHELAYANSPLIFALADITTPRLSAAFPSEPFDWILSFATFHHLPGREARMKVLQTLTEHLRPDGMFVMSNWQFTRSERLMKRVADWSTIGLAERDVEPGDYLLTWERAGKRGLRYVHLLDEAEARALAKGAGLEVMDVFESDGGTGALAEYVMLMKIVD